MSFLSSISARIWPKKRPVVTAPKPPENAHVIYLREGMLDWSNHNDVKRAMGTSYSRVRYAGTNLDLRGCVLSGAKLSKPSKEQDEGALGLNLHIPGFTLANGWVSSIPGGIKARAAYTDFLKLIFIDVREDALSAIGKEAKGIHIDNCSFYGDGNTDTLVQLNQADIATIMHSQFYNALTAMRMQKDSYKVIGATAVIRHCLFVSCRDAVNAAGGIQVKTGSLTFESVSTRFVTSNKARFIDS